MGVRQQLLSLISGNGLMIQSNTQYPACGMNEVVLNKVSFC